MTRFSVSESAVSDILVKWEDALSQQQRELDKLLSELDDIAGREKYEPLYRILKVFLERTYQPTVQAVMARHMEEWMDSDGSILQRLTLMEAADESSLAQARILQERMAESLQEAFALWFEPTEINDAVDMTQELQKTIDEIQEAISQCVSRMEETTASYQSSFENSAEENDVYTNVEGIFSILMVDLSQMTEVLKKDVDSLGDYLGESHQRSEAMADDARSEMMNMAENDGMQALEDISAIFQYR